LVWIGTFPSVEAAELYFGIPDEIGAQRAAFPSTCARRSDDTEAAWAYVALVDPTDACKSTNSGG
jgi:hypothetical protein